MVKNTKKLKIIDTVNRITTTVEKIPNLKLLILFGSRARGEHRLDSDWDLAISYDETNRQTGIKEISNDYLTSLSILSELFEINRDSIDLIELDRCSPLMKYQVARDGKLIYEKNTGDFLKFRVRAWKEYADTAKFRKIQKDSIDLWLKQWGV
ncbi:MAG: nucleotidyltransferase domain-containing protein [Microcystis aeruginosa Ma_MB_S_20031200_S102]|uniref:Nucleotidyltransferase domain-containing protein n=1 Tax=Microcystis aeruginosa Ma_MB_S_20031200_S102 TaxID=2486254 RepID=A0A552EU52_MICAE|nr:MAG: nucleotidyltransferase domain-containing protein [Microcystis aeruginosa Ma_MB_S_20031200_S102D]TRU37985.1 MAG: nucleotidyltransferase domain-containing protein [Microcystis aeruginosa Ma_MB_S_20031200_S102]